MKNLTPFKQHDFKSTLSFTGKYMGRNEHGDHYERFVFQDNKGAVFAVPETPNTLEAIAKVQIGDVLQITATKWGFDVGQLEGEEIEQWENGGKEA